MAKPLNVSIWPAFNLVRPENFPVGAKSIDARQNRRIVGSNFRWASAPHFESKPSSATKRTKVWRADRTLATSDLFISGKTYRENGVIASEDVVENTTKSFAKIPTFAPLPMLTLGKQEALCGLCDASRLLVVEGAFE